MKLLISFIVNFEIHKKHVFMFDKFDEMTTGLQEADLVAPVIDAHLDAFDLDAVDDLGRQ